MSLDLHSNRGTVRPNWYSLIVPATIKQLSDLNKVDTKLCKCQSPLSGIGGKPPSTTDTTCDAYLD